MKKQTWKMRFNGGKPCTWDGDFYDEERDNYEFEADLLIYGFDRGRSSAVITFIPYENREKDPRIHKPFIIYRVFLSDSIEILKHTVNGRIKGIFTWIKKGANFGLKLVKAL